MKSFAAFALVCAWALPSIVHALNILVSNDDGFGASNIRELYRLLRAAGHDAWMVAPAVDNSGQGGRLVYTTLPNLTSSTEYNLVPAGAPSLGTDPHDSHIWYYNGTPAACAAVGIDYVLPKFANFNTPDLLVSGPNFGDNIGIFAYTGSGTIGAAYTAVERDIPAIAFSATNTAQSYTALTNTSNPATWAAELSVQLVNRLANATKPGDRILPLGYGLNVNYPVLNESCLNPPFVQSRFTGDSATLRAVYNATTGVFGYGTVSGFSYGLITAGQNQCINGNCSLPGETDVVKSCQSSVTIFTVDYDAPANQMTAAVEGELGFHDSAGGSSSWAGSPSGGWPGHGW